MNHIGLYLSNTVDKNFIIEEILSNNYLQNYVDLSGLHGELFSTITINRMIDEEFRHERFLVFTDENPGLLSMSSGQQRKALLKYVLSKSPQYIILDDVFGSVDKETQQFIFESLNQLASSTLLIQLFYRRQDVLDFMQTVLSIYGDNKIVNQYSLQEFISSKETLHSLHHLILPHFFSDTGSSVNPVIQLNSISAMYGEKRVLHDICWTVQAGEFWQLKGPIGSGKSTLLAMITGDSPKGYGQDMVLFGRKKGSGETIWDIRKKIGYFTPNMTLQFTHMDTVENMIISGLVDTVGLYRKPTDLQRDIANAWLQILGPSFRNKHFRSLSFGQQRILMVVRAIVKLPPLIILDEPTVGLDDENTLLFLDLIDAIASRKRAAVIYVSHRTETDLKPDKVYELKPAPGGSVGYVVDNSQFTISN